MQGFVSCPGTEQVADDRFPGEFYAGKLPCTVYGIFQCTGTAGQFIQAGFPVSALIRKMAFVKDFKAAVACLNGCLYVAD